MGDSLIYGDFKNEMTFYSWMALMQSLNGITNAHHLSKKLMGNASSGLRIDFPSNLSFFCQYTSAAFGDASYVGQKHTSLPYFTRFRDLKLWDTCINIMEDNSVEFLKFHLGLPPSNAHDYTPLKYCNACFEIDLSIHGFAFWHRVHQLPTCNICPVHGETLQYQPLREDARDRSKLVLPSEHFSKQIILPENANSILARLSILSQEALLKLLPGGYDPIKLMHTYRHGLKEQGFLTKRGLIRAEILLLAFENYYSNIKTIAPFQEIISNKKVHNILKLLRKPRGNHHTAEHIIMIDFLFGSWELFASTYQWESQFQFDFQNNNSILYPPVKSKVSGEIYEIVSRYDNGESLSSLCLEMGYDIGTVMRQINKHGLTKLRKRPKSLTQEKINEVLVMLSEGKSIAEVVKNSHLSKSTIDRICAENQEVWKAWKLAKNKKMCDERRQLLTDYISLNNSATVSDIRVHFNKEYKWLSTHDPEWLNNFASKLNKKQTKRTAMTPTPRVDWEARDQVCLKFLQELGELELESWERKKPRAFLRRLPKLEFKPRLQKLPKSRIWIQDQISFLNKAL